MKDVAIADFNDILDSVFEEIINEDECFTITDETGRPLAVLMSYEEYESINSKDW